MKFAIYAIVKNEEKHIQKFISYHLQELQEQDSFIILDTGSTDNTTNIINKYANKIKLFTHVFEPFRFDDARNMSLDLVPLDVDFCISLDADETLSKGWRQKIEDALEPLTTKLHFPYIYSWQDDKQTIPNSTAYQEKCHSRHGYRWIHCVHERVEWNKNPDDEKRKVVETPVLIHHPDESKERNYLPLCIQACKEDPDDYWSSNYLVQEYQKQNKIDEALDEALRFLTITNDACKNNLTTKYGKDIVAVKQLRASICTEIAAMYASSKQNIEQAIAWAMRAIGEAPEVRDNWLCAAEFYLILKKKYMAFEATKKEWCELYTFFRLLADGRVALGTAEAKAGDIFWPVAI